MSTNARTVALMRFGVARQLRAGRWTIGYAAFAAVFAAGVLWFDNPHGTFGDGVVLAFVIALNFGIARDRADGFDRFMENFVHPNSDLLRRVAIAFLLAGILLTLTFVTAALTWREPRLAAWHACHALLIFWLIAPLALLIEVLFHVSVPAALALLIIGLAVVGIITRAAQPEAVISFLGFQPQTGSFRSLGRLLVASTLWNLIPTTAVLVAWRLQHRRHQVAAGG